MAASAVAETVQRRGARKAGIHVRCRAAVPLMEPIGTEVCAAPARYKYASGSRFPGHFQLFISRRMVCGDYIVYCLFFVFACVGQIDEFWQQISLRAVFRRGRNLAA